MARLRIAFIRGAGDVGTAVGLLLRSLGYAVIYGELPKPTVLRRFASFAECVYRGRWEVQGVEARLAVSAEEALALAREGIVAVLAPEGAALSLIKPDLLVDARMAKRNAGTRKEEAPLVIGLGPGFTAGLDCHAAVETLEGPDLGRVYLEGSPAPPTHRPCQIGGLAEERIVRAPKAGEFKARREIGDEVEAGDLIAFVDDRALLAPIRGVIRGLIHDGLWVRRGMKVAEIDPRGDPAIPYALSTRSLRIAEGVAEALRLLAGPPGRQDLPEKQGV